MKRSAVFIAVVAFALAVSVTFAQKKPDFSGRWVVVSPADAAGQESIIKQDVKTLTEEHASEGPGHTMTVRLDGEETRSVMTSHGSDIVTLSKAVWDAERLVIASTSTYGDGRKLEQKRVMSLDAKGQLVNTGTATMTGRPTETFTVVSQKR